MIYEFCNTYNIYKYCAVEADSLEEAIIRLQLPENKFERKSEKEKLINTTYRYHLDDGQIIRKSFELDSKQVINKRHKHLIIRQIELLRITLFISMI